LRAQRGNLPWYPAFTTEATENHEEMLNSCHVALPCPGQMNRVIANKPSALSLAEGKAWQSGEAVPSPFGSAQGKLRRGI
jgi:hypothetical protein